MQDTRLNNLIAASARQLNGWLANPWRRTSVQGFALLLGFFLAGAAVTTAGQAAVWDMSVTAVLIALCEFINIVVYRREVQRSPSLTNTRSPEDLPSPPRSRPLITALNLLKIGLMYGLFLEGFKLGS
ncbi:MAG: DUF565 domain-containing protein [Cyanobacteria bacterium P01_F01_bin.153]